MFQYNRDKTIKSERDGTKKYEYSVNSMLKGRKIYELEKPKFNQVFHKGYQLFKPKFINSDYGVLLIQRENTSYDNIYVMSEFCPI